MNGGYLYILSFLNSILIARTLGPAGQGEVSYANTIIGILVHFGGFGIDLADKYYVAKNKKDLSNILGVSIGLFFFYLISGTVFFCIKTAFDINFNISVFILVFILLKFPSDIINSQLQNVLIGLSKIRIYNTTRLIAGASYPSMVFLLWLCGNISSDIVIMCAMIASLLSFVVTVMYLLKYYHARFSFNLHYLFAILPYGIKMYIGVLFNYFLLRSDVLMVNYFIGKSQTGLYSLASSLADILLTISSSVALILQTKLIELPDDRDRIFLENKAIKAVLFIMLIAVIFAGLIGGELIRIIYGVEFAGSIRVFRILMPGILFWGLNSIISSYFAAINRLNITVIAAGISFFINVILNYLLIPRIGIIGAGFASSISYGIDTLIRGMYYMRLRNRTLFIK